VGELVRLVLLVSDEPVSGAHLSAMVVERLLDVLAAGGDGHVLPFGICRPR
jgi:hypothetical protein